MFVHQDQLQILSMFDPIGLPLFEYVGPHSDCLYDFEQKKKKRETTVGAMLIWGVQLKQHNAQQITFDQTTGNGKDAIDINANIHGSHGKFLMFIL